MITESLLRAGRVSRHLPWLKGLGLVCHFYDAVLPLPDGWRGRVDDFDGDLKLDVDPREIIGINVWHRPRLFEKQERELFCSAIKAGSIVLDVGANIGIYTLLAAKRGAKVFAIEADPQNASRLREHVRLNGFEDRVTIIEMAATDSERAITLYRDPINCGHSNIYSGTDGVTIPGKMIDSLGLPPIDLCKMDIEGSEVFALRGMVKTISNSPQMKLLVEYNSEFSHASELLSLLRAHFKGVDIVGAGSLSDQSKPPRFCNLWLHHPIFPSDSRA